MANLEVWERRWQALDEIIDGYYQQRLDGLNSSIPSAQTLQGLVKQLKVFGKGHFVDYFYNGFVQGTLAESEEYPPAHVLSVILDRIADDFTIIRRVTSQRFCDPDEMKVTLRKADALVRQALKPAEGLGLEDRKADEFLRRLVGSLKPAEKLGLEDLRTGEVKQHEWEDRCLPTTAVAYFRRSAAIRVVPYASVALIGIPFTCVSVPRDYLAIPHEVGHYVYWHGKIEIPDRTYSKPVYAHLGERLRKDKKIPEWVEPWVEEIFADVYGCLVAGPVIALDFQDLQLSESRTNFARDDGAHPTPALRPYIYTRVLERMGLGDWAASLNRRWEECLKERGNPSEITLSDKDARRADMSHTWISSFMVNLCTALRCYEVKLPRARQKVDEVVDVVYDLLEGKGLDFSSNWWKLAYSELSSPAPENWGELENLYNEFANHLLDPALIKLPSCELELSPRDLADPWEAWKGGVLRVIEEVLRRKGEVIIFHQEPVREDVWGGVWRAEGWGSKGPKTLWP